MLSEPSTRNAAGLFVFKANVETQGPECPRPDGDPWGKSHQQRPLIEACKRAKIAPAVSFHVLRHTHGSLLAMEGVPLAVIAKQLGHADTRMTERHVRLAR